MADIDNQTVIRLNRDTLYSFGVFDLDAAPVKVTLPDAGKRYMALQVIDEDQYAPAVFYAPGTHTLHEAEDRHAVRLPGRADVREPRRRGRREGGACSAGRHPRRAAAPGKFETPDWDRRR